MRLQRALAAAGFGSRRQCELLILEGRVEVDGQVVNELGTTIDWNTSKVYVDGTPLKPRRHVYYAVNKPAGVVTTNSDPEGRPRVIDLVPPDERVFPVGRLDRSSEGLILLTNDGDLAQKLAHPRYEIKKVYRVTVAGNVGPEALRQMEQGVYIAEGLVRVEGARVLKARSRATEMEITLKEGKNREIRRILARLGHKVQTLKRIAIGTLRLGEMPTGAYRRLSSEEIKKLQQSAEQPLGKPPRVRQRKSAARPATGPQRRPRKAAAATRPLQLPSLGELGAVRTGRVIGADALSPKPPVDKTAAKSHIVRPRSAAKSAASKKSGAQRAAPGRAGQPRPAGRRKKGH